MRQNVALCGNRLKRNPFKNIEGKEENAGKQHFLLFPQCFQSYRGQILSFGSPLICHLQMLSIWTSMKMSSCERVENIRGKGENAAYRNYHIFPQFSQRAFFS